MNKTTINPSEIGKQLAIPQVNVIEDGKEVVRPDVLQAVVQLASLGQLAKIRKSLEKAEYRGIEDPRVLLCTDQLQYIDLINRHPDTPWIAAYFINTGPDTAIIGINEPHEGFLLFRNATITVNREHADERIRGLYYQCNLGETATVFVTGQY